MQFSKLQADPIDHRLLRVNVKIAEIVMYNTVKLKLTDWLPTNTFRQSTNRAVSFRCYNNDFLNLDTSSFFSLSHSRSHKFSFKSHTYDLLTGFHPKYTLIIYVERLNSIYHLGLQVQWTIKLNKLGEAEEKVIKRINHIKIPNSR